MRCRRTKQALSHPRRRASCAGAGIGAERCCPGSPAHGLQVVADPEDPRSVAAAIRELSADPERLTMMGRRAREIAANFEMDKELQRFREALESIAGSDGGDSNSVA